MSKFCCTFPGKYGDILWSLPTAKFIAEKVVGCPVDFAIMPYYESILPLIQEQSYIDRAFVVKHWLKTHSNYGDQPWEAPVYENYERGWHLGYRCHPGKAFGNPEMALIDFIAYQQGIAFSESPIPFITASECSDVGDDLHLDYGNHIVLALNELYAGEKEQFKQALVENLNGICSVCLLGSNVTWTGSVRLIRDALCYVGDRSANWVIANGLGKECITYEPHPARHASGYLGKVFGNPYGKEVALPLLLPPKVAGETAAAMVKKLVVEKVAV